MKKITGLALQWVSFLFLVVNATFASAQNAGNTAAGESADVMRSNGLIYVVIGVIVIILCGLILYVNSIDRKLRKMEKESEK